MIEYHWFRLFESLTSGAAHIKATSLAHTRTQTEAADPEFSLETTLTPTAWYSFEWLSIL